MTQPEVKTIKRDGSRFYVDPISGAKVPSVTSIVGCLPKRPLMYWRGKMVAEAAVEDFGVVADFISKGNPSAAIDHLKRAPDRSSGVAAKTGSDVHNLCERINRHDLHGHRPHTGHLLQLHRGGDQLYWYRCRWQHSKPYHGRCFRLVGYWFLQQRHRRLLHMGQVDGFRHLGHHRSELWLWQHLCGRRRRRRWGQ